MPPTLTPLQWWIIAAFIVLLLALDSCFQWSASQTHPLLVSYNYGGKMAIKPSDLREVVIQPALEPHGLYTPDVEELLMLTAAQESKLGYHLTQMDGDKLLYNNAVSPWQIERNTFNWLKKAYPQFIGDRMFEELAYDLRFSALVARIRYYVVKEAIPARASFPSMMDWITALARYYKQYFNTYAGAATVPEAVANYKRYVINGEGQ